jgi:spermidine/putrescine-binding protein
MTIAAASNRNVGSTPERVQDLAVFISGRSSRGLNRAMLVKDQVVETELGKEGSNSWLDNMVVEISSNNKLVTGS